MIDPKTTNVRKRHRQTGLLVALAVGMFGFAFALVPLYDVFCEITGINGKTSSQPASAERIEQVSDREVTIQFLARAAKGMPWEFRPTEARMRVRLGEVNTTEFYVHNRAAGAVTGQAVPSVSPGVAAQHLQKLECFCFRQQELDGGDDMSMPVQFYVDTDLPEDVDTLSLSYTLFRVNSPRSTAADAL